MKSIIIPKKFARGVNIKFKQIERGISKLEDRTIKIILSEKQNEKNEKKNDQSLRELWEISKYINMFIQESQKIGDTEKGRKNILRNND